MEYICYKRFRGKGLNNEMLNIRRGSELEELEGLIAFGSKSVCINTSQIAYDYFARNDDEQGLERGDLILEIKKKLSKRDDKYQTRWNKLWEDTKANTLRRPDFTDFWIWGYQFYNASIEDLQHIRELIKNV